MSNISLTEALRQQYTGINVGTDADADCVIVGGRIVHWSRPDPQPIEADVIAAYDPAPDIAAAAAAEADTAAYQSERTEVASNLSAMRDRLVLIRDAASPTNAQVIQAVRDLAAIELRMLNYIRRL